MVDEKRLLDVVTNVVLACQELPSDDQLSALQLAWWAPASSTLYFRLIYTGYSILF